MNKVYALVKDNKVINSIIWDGNTQTYTPPAVTVDLTGVVPIPTIGWSYIDGNFVPPTPLIPPAPTAQEIFDTALLEGFDTGKGYRLAMQPDDISLFNGLQTLIQSQIISYQLTGNTDGITAFMASSYSIKDINGEMHEDTIQSIFQVIVNYGLYYSQLWQNKQ